ncbi:RluA family pseudouridine synthase [Alkalihalobacterium chitinilyticum]|uniref:Pseudouridine synthase n=1 Tax=Alkalihalobacterium chitinilyticum TaxID=2980103 RepID=A0ABT5VBD1_9BACI|nr:RluA family pseudouridine synthase [Alkalihalobacterium chitinilyticum]MDE5412652.1 RluA family pseudouridine synthase [Alkalihalobacterium chitinilyticum]
MTGLQLQWLVGDDWDGKLLREFLKEEKKLSKRALADIKFAGGSIFVNGEFATVRKTLQMNDEVEIIFPAEVRSGSIVPEKIGLDILYEDAHLLVVNKPAGMPTIPSRDHVSGTLANAVLYYYDQHGISSTFHAVNRLDKDTSGIVVIAKHRFAHDLMAKEQQNGGIHREYIAITHGIITTQKGTINAPIGRKTDSIIEREVRSDGQKAITHFRVLSRTAEETVVRVKLETGRTHQIRVHFSNLGHPLIGDDLYGGERTKIERQALHSFYCSFLHPLTLEKVSLEAPLPPDMKNWIE